MTNNQKWCFIVTAVCGLLLVVQLFLYRQVNKKSLSTEQVVRYRSEAYEFLKTVTSISADVGVTLTLADPHLLNDLLIEHDFKRHCRFLCSWKSLSLVAFEDDFELVENQFIEELHQRGYKFDALRVKDPRVRDGDVIIPAHYLVSYQGYLVHIAFFYQRPGNYWWHSAHPRAPHGLSFTSHPGAFDRQEVRTSVLDGIKFYVFSDVKKFVTEAVQGSHFLECNHTRGAQFRSDFPDLPYNSAFHAEAKKILSLANSRLNDLFVPFWLSSGTLLGWFRQCDFITYSKDVDLGIFIKDYTEEIVPHFRATGLPLEHSFGFVRDSYQLSFKSGTVKLDFFFFYEEGNHVWNGGTQAKTLKKFKYTFPSFTLCWTEFMELKVRVPCDPQTYIEANYGKDWYRPVTEWDWKRSPPNVAENGRWSEEQAEDAVQIYDKRGRLIVGPPP